MDLYDYIKIYHHFADVPALFCLFIQVVQSVQLYHSVKQWFYLSFYILSWNDWNLDFFMYRLNMCSQTSLSCSLMVTLIAKIFDFFVYRLNMCLKMWLWRSLVVTLITRIFDFLMYRLNMCPKIWLWRSLMIALIARIFNFFMNRLNMIFQTSQSCSLMVT